ncbi:Leucine-rich repeat-containing protein 42 [Amphibalanus amphitrite]|uniref:Leucine-rich repeat-containing protein 42 n=1 Tax=Amphibalanus amphitrite TaxID=1232801 RepID=A0A6A4V3L6_AMPAM|nr:Leucine-rich repeat-containing protein 42 [Amphibalanus amphitrite]
MSDVSSITHLELAQLSPFFVISPGLSCTAAPAPEPSTGPDLPPRPARPDDDLSPAPAAGVPWSAGSRVAPLFELCLQLAAGWLDRLESLVGFPELVGELLVRRALRLKVFDRGDQRCRRALALCVAAYPDQVLPSVRIPDLLTLSEYEEPLETLWSSLTRLDLSGCRLGDRHPALSHIANAAGLTHLYLRDCALTDAGLRSLTLPARMSGSGLHALRRVDVRDNQLSCRSLVMLCRLKPHQIAASVTVNAEDKAALQSRGYSLVEPFDAEEVTNQGWLAPLVDTWSERPFKRCPAAAGTRCQAALAGGRLLSEVFRCGLSRRLCRLAVHPPGV